MDTAKAVADKFHAAVVIIPYHRFHHDAPTIGLSVIYDDEGNSPGARHYAKNPDLVLIDTDVISKAPIRFLVAGMGDALSTYVEARANFESHSPNYVSSGFASTLAVKAIAKMCHETILSKGVRAKWLRSKSCAPLMWKMSSKQIPCCPVWVCKIPAVQALTLLQKHYHFACLPSSAAWRGCCVWHFGSAADRRQRMRQK